MAQKSKYDLSKISMIDLRRRIRNLREADLRSLADEAVSTRIGILLDQYALHVRPQILNGLYRARLNEPGQVFTSASELWCPQSRYIVRPSRLNGRGQRIFYGASTSNTAMLELRPKPGDTATVLLSGTASGMPETLHIAFIGVERSQAPDVEDLIKQGSFRHSLTFRQNMGEATFKKWLEIDDYLSSIFAEPVPVGQEHKYKPTRAVGDLLFSAPGLDAINYPSVATSDIGINIAMLPDRANALLRPMEAWMVGIHETSSHPVTGEPLWRITFRSRTRPIQADGALHWESVDEERDREAILRFVQGRIQNLHQWSAEPAARP